MILVLLPIVLSAAITAQAPAPADATLGAEFVALEREWMDALVRHADPRNAGAASTLATLEGYLAPEYVLVVSAQPSRLISRADWLANADRYVIHEFRQRDLVARRIGDTVVTSLVHWQRATVGQPPVERSGEFFIVDVWRKVDGRWKVASRYSGKVEEPRGSSAGAIVASPPPRD
jgi:hypothetical protein